MRNPNIDYGLSDEQKMIRESVLSLLEKAMPRERILEMDEARQFPIEAYMALAEAGWIGLPHEREYGGSEGSCKDLAIFVETVSYHNAQLASAYLTTAIYGGMQVKYGASAEVKAEILPKLVSGALRLALCITEPATGSDVASISTRAVQDGDDYLISGQKVYITCAHMADYLVVATKTNPDARHKGITLFLVDAHAPGVAVRPLKGLGRRMIHTNEVFFDDVRVSSARMLGELNGGWRALMRGLNIERLCLAAAACGNMMRIIDDARDFATQRAQFGNPISSYQAIAHKFADMQIMATSARVMTLHVAEMLDAGQTPTMETAIAKVQATESNSRCADMGMQIMGGAGYMMEHPMQMYFRDARVGTIGGGTSEIMRSIIAKQMGL
ncbi:MULTISPECIES: acyl-CoA dehydrogenase family protein [Alcaligenaceae]|uniref:Acyl-CoA dehydrogenase n=1 Tax=Bordetella petrii (strain ATCC BAA-461 / DSM 12804 / CCUG 43448 / CIP 107267 / Se-1111R) TaxID=340100 RepID=A9ICA9_BORPD|nr:MULTISPECIES: acyl-CoA dehydrogenase family protein [Alcaligenaceae]CAP41545.1 acyl-CoA dehydrogenase [Bordetella petrii]